MNPNLENDIIAKHAAAAAADCKRLISDLTDLHRHLTSSTVDMRAVANIRDGAKALWAQFALKTRTLDTVVQRMAVQALRAHLVGAAVVDARKPHPLVDMFFKECSHGSDGGEVFVNDVVAPSVLRAIWKGLHRTLGLDAGEYEPPALRLPRCDEGWQLHPRWTRLLTEAELRELRREYVTWLMQGVVGGRRDY